MGGWWRRRRNPDREHQVIDLRDVVPAPVPRAPATLPSVARTEAQFAALVERRRAEVAQAEAQRELEALRKRHWSPERIFEESRLGIDWWEHPLADPHAVLGLLPGDTFADATTARRAIAKAVHPDVAHGESGADAQTAAHQMAAVNGAYDRMRRALGPLPETPAPASAITDEIDARSSSRWSAALAPLPHHPEP